MTESMIERVARALARNAQECRNEIWTASGKPHLARPPQISAEHSWPLFAKEARAAIEAMREPTQAMRDRYNDEDVVGYGPDGSDHDKVWQAGIDAALEETP